MSSCYMCLDKILILVPLLNAHIISQFQTAIISYFKHSTTITIIALLNLKHLHKKKIHDINW